MIFLLNANTGLGSFQPQIFVQESANFTAGITKQTAPGGTFFARNNTFYDANNNPTNPFLFGYRVADTIPPMVRSISITPLNVDSRVDADVNPLIEKPVLINNRNYKMISKPLVSGNIGFAIDCFDQADGVNNRFAVYRLDFYVDGNLFFYKKINSCFKL